MDVLADYSIYEILGAETAILGAIGLAAYGLYEGITSGHHKDEPPHNDPDSGIAEDDNDDDYQSDPDTGKGLQPGPRGIPPAHDHTSHQDSYVNHGNESGTDYWHYFNLLCRKFYNRHRRLAWAQPEKYALAVYYFMRRHRRVPRRVFNRSALIEGPRDYHIVTPAMLARVRRRASGRMFLAS